MKILGGGSLQILFALLIVLHMQSSIGFYSTTTDDEVWCIERERQALLAFKQGLVDEYDCLSSWGSEEEKKECCKWEGVQCSNTTRHVVELYLNHCYLRGNLNPSLFELQHLTYLDLSVNDFNLSCIPESIGSLNKLQYLQLDFGNLSGFLLNQLGNLTSLNYLVLMFNNFNIENLEWLSLLSYLQHLDLSGCDLNKVKNYLFQVINKLPQLTYLALNECNLRGVIPLSIPMTKISKNLVHLELRDNHFQGLIPENFSHMTYLETLDLTGNHFQGGIPKSFGNLCKLRFLNLFYNKLDVMLPELIGNLSGCLQLSLEGLFLGGNKIKGPLPDTIRNFPSLGGLYLENNQLSGTVPKSIQFLSKLEALDISSNSLNGMITESHFSTPSKLQYLDMSFNSLSINLSHDWSPPFHLDHIRLGLCKLGPKFPRWLKTQKTFSYLDISSNEISDSIPKWFWNLSSTAYHVNLSSNQIYGILSNFSTNFSGSSSIGIDLSKNKLEGLLPVFPHNLTSINLSQNRFSGSISPLCTISSAKLDLVDVSNNQLSGKLPDCITRWTSLVVLNLANNHLLGKIPSSIGSLYHLESLSLQNNNFSGEIPWALGNCSSLQFLDLSYNSFSGIIPAWIGERLSSLTFLLLRSNNFSGDIPLQLCWLTNIMLLDLSNNNLSGSIPWCIHNLIALAQKESSAGGHGFADYYNGDVAYYVEVYFDKSSVMWKGMERDYGKGNLENLRIIDLSSNKLTGEIPVQISGLFEMVQLNLSRNQFTGRMPPDIGQMRQLESLDLSWNQLSGHLPESMSQLNFLSTLNLSHNNFSGRIPLSTQMQSFDASSFVRNLALCGLPLTPTCPEDEKSKGKATDSGGKDNQEDRAEFWKSFKSGMELGAAIGFVGVMAVMLDHPWKYLCFRLFNNVRVHLSNLMECLYLLVAAVGLVVREHVSRLGRKLKLFEPSVSS
ncbi:hypothetical protein SLA2020_136560 [Shorea laevis]